MPPPAGGHIIIRITIHERPTCSELKRLRKSIHAKSLCCFVVQPLTITSAADWMVKMGICHHLKDLLMRALPVKSENEWNWSMPTSFVVSSVEVEVVAGSYLDWLLPSCFLC
jgi:hypothetical protein